MKPHAPQLNADKLEQMIAHAVTHPQEKPSAKIIPFPRASALTAVAACALLAVTFWLPQNTTTTPTAASAPASSTAAMVEDELFFDFEMLETLDSLAG